MANKNFLPDLTSAAFAQAAARLRAEMPARACGGTHRRTIKANDRKVTLGEGYETSRALGTAAFHAVRLDDMAQRLVKSGRHQPVQFIESGFLHSTAQRTLIRPDCKQTNVAGSADGLSEGTIMVGLTKVCVQWLAMGAMVNSAADGSSHEVGVLMPVAQLLPPLPPFS